MKNIKDAIGKRWSSRSGQPAKGGGGAEGQAEGLSPRAVWLVMFLIGAVIIGIEIYDHYNMHVAHNTNLLLYEDRELVREILMYGIALPILGGVILLLLNRTGAERDLAVEELHHQRAIAEEVHHISDWNALVNRIARFPRDLLPIKRSVLTVFDLDEHGSSFAAAWIDDGKDDLLFQPRPLYTQCQACLTDVDSSSSGVRSCTLAITDSGASEETVRYCLPLKTADDLIAVLNFDLVKDDVLVEHQRQMLADVQPHLAMALNNFQLQHAKLSSADAIVAERQRIARNLHDTLGQNVAYLRLKLDQLGTEGELGQIAAIRHEIGRMQEVADEAYGQLRQTLATLNLDPQLSLAEAIAEVSDAAAARAGFLVHFDSAGRPSTLPAHTKRQVIYVAREALNNIEKHASAQNVWIKLNWGTTDLTMTIADDGLGYDPQTIQSGDRYGLDIMHQRAAAVGGSLSLSSTLNQGTTVSLSLPITEEHRVEVDSVLASTRQMEE